MAWVAATVHMLLWFVKWAKDGTFGQNLVGLELLVTPGDVRLTFVMINEKCD